ncbi:hypothetical protein MKW92_010147, partial [Papaver armeniacum]
MSLQEQLAIFKKQQQEKCQSTLSRSAQRFATSSSIASRAPAVQFSNDTERLLRINSIRKAPIGAQMKRVIAMLYEKKEAFTAEQIYEACYIDVINNRDVFYSLTNNPKVFNDGERFSYKSIIDLKDAYPASMEDLQALKSSGDIRLLSKFDSLEDIAYPNNPKIAITVDIELQQRTQGIELSPNMTANAIT